MEEDRYTRITLRIPRDLHARLQEEADRRSHSQNAEIIDRLQRSLSDAPALNGISMRELFNKLQELEAMIKAGTFVPFSQTEEGKAWTAKRKK